ncbi:MAG: GH92 family glycosyl hydrolase [Bacteroidaceae bacterium]|nr:GH92 family glycosyl hydrolase [Bacteroidaceae bacterium]
MEMMGFNVDGMPLKVDDIDTRTGSDKSAMKSASKFGQNTENYGQTLPAVLQPNGMTFWTPQTRASERKGVSPYYYSDTTIQGLRASHWLVGGATQDYGSFTISAVRRKTPTPSKLATPFSHEDETATPAYYSVSLPEEKIKMEMTGLSRSAIFRFTALEEGRVYLVLNCNSDEDMATVNSDSLHHMVFASNPVHRIYQGWGEEAGFSGHLVMTFDKQPVGCEDFHEIDNETELMARGLVVSFDMNQGESLLVKAATSFVSTDNALMNLQEEIPHWDFEAVRRQISSIWEQQLGKIHVETADKEAIRKFYGSMYRCSFLPRTFSDVDGAYPSFASSNNSPMKVERVGEGHVHYCDFSLWDTYRAMHPLLNILSPKKSADMMQSLVDMYRQGGWMPIFPCWNSYTSAMIGDHVASVVADAYMKGVRGFDVEKAYEGLRQNAFVSPSDGDYKDGKGRRALLSYLNYGYIPLEDSVPDAFHKREQVSRTLEYAYDDFALSVLAKTLGHGDDAKKLDKRAKNYRHVFDPRTGWVQGRYADGSFMADDNAFVKTSFITEGAPCHYSWYVPHDPDGLMECMGGKERFVQKLDSMFSEQNYWHGNEPCHQVAYMYNYAGEAWKTQRVVREIMKTEYLESPSGLAGNDDAGQMSAWYIFSAMGFYPVCPGITRYELASPSFDRVVITLENGRQFCIETDNASPDNIFVKSVTRNGEPYDKNYIDHEDIISGTTFRFTMGN